MTALPRPCHYAISISPCESNSAAFYDLPGERTVNSIIPLNIWDVRPPVHVEVSMGSGPNPIAASREIHTSTKLWEQIYLQARSWKRTVISHRLPSSSTHVKKLAAIIAVLGFVFALWFGVSTYHAPLTSYPYYDTQKPVPPWSEPMPLKGNYHRGGEHK